MEQNPLKIARKAYGLTIKELAEKMGVTPLVIVDVENGCFTRVPPRLTAYLTEYDSAAQEALTQAWEEWRMARRTDVEDPRGAVKAMERVLRRGHLPASFEALAREVGGTLRGFARVMVLQTSLVVEYISKGYHWNPISEALSDIGLSPTMIELIHQLPRHSRVDAELVAAIKGAR